MAKGKLFSLLGWLKILKKDAIILYYAWKHPETPVYIKGGLLALLAYVFSPIDLIPDYLPLLGIADDAVIIPTAVFYLTNMLPETVRKECEAKSQKWRKRIPLILGFIIFSTLTWLTILILGFSYLLF